MCTAICVQADFNQAQFVFNMAAAATLASKGIRSIRIQYYHWEKTAPWAKEVTRGLQSFQANPKLEFAVVGLAAPAPARGSVTFCTCVLVCMCACVCMCVRVLDVLGEDFIALSCTVWHVYLVMLTPMHSHS